MNFATMLTYSFALFLLKLTNKNTFIQTFNMFVHITQTVLLVNFTGTKICF